MAYAAVRVHTNLEVCILASWFFFFSTTFNYYNNKTSRLVNRTKPMLLQLGSNKVCRARAVRAGLYRYCCAVSEIICYFWHHFPLKCQTVKYVFGPTQSCEDSTRWFWSNSNASCVSEASLYFQSSSPFTCKVNEELFSFTKGATMGISSG